MNAAWMLLVVLGCAGKDTTPQETGLSDDSGGDTGPTVLATPFSLWEVDRGTLTDALGVASALTSPTNDHTYVLDEDGHSLRYLTNAYVQPEGEYCLRRADCGE